MRLFPIAALALALSAPVAARADTPYDQGRISLGVSLGTQTNFDETYFSVGGRVGYFVLPGLEVAAGGVKLFGGEPSVAMLSPELRYILMGFDSSLRPFVGTFYRHWFIGEPFDDYDTVGGTLGVMWQQSSNFLLGLGVTHEIVVSRCDEDAGDTCSSTYPAIIIGLSF